MLCYCKDSQKLIEPIDSTSQLNNLRSQAKGNQKIPPNHTTILKTKQLP